MKKFLLLLFSIFAVSVANCSLRWPHRDGDVNGGIPCAACVILTGLGEQLAQLYNETISDSFARLCKFLPDEGPQELCKILVQEFGPGIIYLIENDETPEVACYGVGLCTHETTETCFLFNAPSPSLSVQSLRVESAIKRAVAVKGRSYYDLKDICDIPVVKKICSLIFRFADDHLPVDDIDGDFFSPMSTLRGSYWRGKDCNDADKNIYPGRKSSNDAVVDTNCNGVFGIDTSTGNTYESEWCSKTLHRGTVILGDSVGAHFHIPPEFATASEFNVPLFDKFTMILENEFDWPMLSAATGHMNNTMWKKYFNDTTPVSSIYLKMKEINRCVHRDFQNLGVNGADSKEMMSIVKSLARHIDIDYPLMVILALLGNDVCNHHPDIEHMTTPEDYYNNQLTTLRYLDTILPPDSVVLAVGLVDARVLYDSLHDRIHPLGALNKDVTYTRLYDFLNCLQVSPCFGWMNSNETWRNRTTERAKELSKTLKRLVSEQTFENFKAYYFDAPVNVVIQQWKAKGGKVWQLIEPVDGFHPNQYANDQISRVFWDMIQEKHPEIIPPTNPYNEQINKRFGDQGGY